MWSSVGFRVAQAIGFTGAAWLSGNIAALSMNAVPSLLRAQKETNIPLTATAKQWRGLYEAGKAQNPPVAALTAAAFVYLALSSRSAAPLFRAVPCSRAGLYTTAAILTIGIVPFTIVAMSKTNDALLKVAGSDGGSSVASDAEIEGLLHDWVSLNRVRSFLPLLGSLTAIAAALL
ncbi:hypothetical protein Asppvi_009381 [Aspergillus pseudoviridinutans]|uniref:DUF1772-domain-containing protein n=1 Tax=Aspergillus pseudoviridinutans TaxID=1517512 RepID=A0A9P3EYF0_9EURO|nr:uncharacterized protein Asppvi_009381 [Aspergillus pseudoviridinutans]GIJ90427.1 hypothetical protein Asppvi_009381 [Aspergillus pseudoviridinutans]